MRSSVETPRSVNSTKVKENRGISRARNPRAGERHGALSLQRTAREADPSEVEVSPERDPSEGAAPGGSAPSEARPAEAIRRGSGAEVDLRGADLSDEDLSGVNLAGLDLTEARLTRTNLAHAKLSFCILRGAHLGQANLDGAELLGSDLSEADLSECSAERTGLGGTNLTRATLNGARLKDATLSRATMSGALFGGAHLESARLCECDLSKADFTNADLSRADLRQSDVTRACFHDTNLRDANLRGVRGYTSASWLGADTRDANFRGASLMRRHIEDENYLHEFRTQSRANAMLYLVWWITSDCGRSLYRWAACTGLLALLFAVAYRSVAIDFGPNETVLSPLYFSVVTLTTLGYGDALPVSVMAQLVVMAEVITGYVALGGLLSVFATKMGRRAE